MKILADLFPVILFFIAYQLFDIYIATQVAIAAAAVQVVYNRLRYGKVETMHWVTLGLLVLFGGLTLALRDPTFIKWKPTVV
ncbi:MAG: septation protein IspZ, partial [Gammaproteobacteria bacterium]|nr:septation protein IspZ [Gammaproteobacteria bacterium]